jgi:hypothetical protein
LNVGVPKRRFRLLEVAQIGYRITGIRGSLATSFTARPGLACVSLGACGTSGELKLTLGRGGRLLTFVGERFVKHRVGAKRAVADLLSGRLHLSDDSYGLGLSGNLSGAVLGAGLPACRDSVSARSVDLSSRTRGAIDRFSLDPPSDLLSVFSSSDPLRTRCPGPGADDILRPGSLATGALALTNVGGRRLELVLHSGGRFGGRAYAGTRSGTITIDLARAKTSGRTERVRAGVP